MQRSSPRVRPTTSREPGFNELMGVMGDVNKRYGGNVMQRATSLIPVPVIETGVFMLDFALLGGVHDGRTAIFYGYESSGKTTMAMRVAAASQRKYPDRAVVYLDVEGTYDPTWATEHGVNAEALFYVQPASGEEAVDIAHGVLTTPETAVLIIDSLPALVPYKEADASAEDDFMAMRARLIAKLCAKIIVATGRRRSAGQHETTVIMVNQFRTKVGFVMGDPRVLPGGNQPKFMSSSMVELSSKPVLGKNTSGLEIVTHNDQSFKVKKHKGPVGVATGGFKMVRDPEHELGLGAMDDAPSVVAMAKKMGVHTGAGQAQYLATTGDHKFRSGHDIAAFLRDDPDELRRAKQLMILMQRKANGMPILPPDGHLLGEVDEDVLAYAEEA
jgi:protein RecA